jgi:hypothetical protein
MGAKMVKPSYNSPPSGKERIGVIGFTVSHHTAPAVNLARMIADQYPEKYETWFYFTSKEKFYRVELPWIKEKLPEAQRATFLEHDTAPFCWLDTGEIQGLGGRDMLCEWAIKTFPENPGIVALANRTPSLARCIVDKRPGTAST